MIERLLLRVSAWTRGLAYRRLRDRYPSEWADINRLDLTFTQKQDEFLHEARTHLLEGGRS